MLFFANGVTITASPTNANTAIGGTVFYNVAANSGLFAQLLLA